MFITVTVRVLIKYDKWTNYDEMRYDKKMLNSVWWKADGYQLNLPHGTKNEKLRKEINKSSAVAEMGNRGHNRHGPKRGGAVPLSRVELGPRLTQCGLGWGILPYQMASSSIQPFGHNRHGPKIGSSAPFWRGGAGLPSNTMWPEPRPACMPSSILIHRTVWPQYTNVTDRQDRHDNGPIA